MRYYNSWIEVTPAENLDQESDQTDPEESSSMPFQSGQDKSMSLSFIANAADDDNDNDDIFGTSFLPFTGDNQLDNWSDEDDDIIFQHSENSAAVNAESNSDSDEISPDDDDDDDDGKDDTDGCASCERTSKK